MKLSVDDLPMFFDSEHRALGETLRKAAAAIAAAESGGGEYVDQRLVSAMVAHGLFAHAVAADGIEHIDARTLCLIREMLGYTSPRADAIFAVQGLGSFVPAAAGSAEQRAELPRFADGHAVAAFALTEPGAGSDVAALATTATRSGNGWVLSGEKTFISNLGIASHATVFATIDPAQGRRGITAFWLPLDAPGVRQVAQHPSAPHPIGRLLLENVALGEGALLGEPGAGFSWAMRALDTFRVTVGAAAVGMARRAFDEALAHVTTRHQFGKPLAEQQLVQAHLADMLVDLDAARLLVLRAAWQRDEKRAERVTTEVSIAKLGATEAAQRVIDRAVQLLGGGGVLVGGVVEHLYRAIRPLRIYEGTSEIQRTIIGRAVAEGAKRGW
jgi:acyl-CoA dehydrogenase